MLKQQIDQDLKVALLARDKGQAMTLRSIKSAILYEEVAKGLRDEGLSDDAIIALLGKEAKKRQESADLYRKGGDAERAQNELIEKKVIDRYLPQQLSDDELAIVIDEVISCTNAQGMQAMGTVIGAVKHKVGGQADGTRIAVLVKGRLSD